MGEYELIFFAAVAAFFAFKLWSVLGRTNGDEKSRAAETTIIIEKKPASMPKPTLLKKADAKVITIVEEIVPEQFKADVAAIKKLDPSFTLETFLKGAESAFEAVIAAYSKGNRSRLKFLLNDEVFSHFDAQITEHEARDEKAHISLVSVDNPEITHIELIGKVAHISLKFNTEQINFVTDKSGSVVLGSKTHIERVKDVWVFERDLASRKPQWLVVGTDGE